MIKLLLIISIVLIAYWMGKQSAILGRKKVKKREIENKPPVIDIEPED